MSASFLLFALVAGSIALLGVLLAFTPWLMKKRECFTVTVPESAQGDARFAAFRKRYAAAVLATTLVCVVAAGALAFALSAQEGSLVAPMREGAIVALLVFASVAPVAVSFGLMLHYRKKVQVIKEKEGWRASRAESVALVGFEEAPKPPSLVWNAVLYIPIILVTLVVGAVLYPGIPDVVPMHVGFDGAVDAWTSKSMGIVAFPVLLEVFMAACFVFAHWAALRSKKDLDPTRPAISAYAYGAFVRAECIMLLAGGAMLTAVFGIVFLLAMADVLSIVPTVALLVAATLVLTVCAVGVSVAYGQSGSRLMRRLSENDGLPTDDDACWKLGVLYFNRGDASLFVPARFGIGWTVNWARPATWAIVIGFTVATIALVVGCALLLQ